MTLVDTRLILNFKDLLELRLFVGKDDYRRFIADKSDGFTQTGIHLLNQSIEAYVFAVLGSQANKRISIVGKLGGSLEPQEKFRQF
jgi:hypothetical protein